MMTTLAFVTVFCLVAVLVYMARYSGRVRITRIRLIDAPMDQVFAQLADFQHWQAWIPWLAHACDAGLKLTGSAGSPGSQCAWDHAQAGAGVFKLVGAVANKRIAHKLWLKLPFVVRGRSSWTLAERDGKTEVIWQISGRVAFAMRAFSQTVQGALELECRYGLDRLASLLEPADAPRYQLTVTGPRDVGSCRYVYQTYQGSIQGLPQAMRRCFAELRRQLDQQGVAALGAPLAFYTRTNIKLRTTTCHMGWPVGSDNLGQMALREMPAHRAFGVTLKGDSSALEIAWYYAMQRLTIDNFKPDQRLPPYETYQITSDDAQLNDCLTEVAIPILIQK